jgi:membrane protease YdiL (CAAX protease family)
MPNYAGIALVTALLAVCQHFAFQLERAGTTAFWVLAVAPNALVALYAGVRAYRDDELKTWMRPVWGDFTRGVLGAAVLFAAAYAFARFCSGSARESWLARIYLQFGDPKFLKEHPLPFAAGIVVGAAAEEMVWRGLVTTWLGEKLGTRWAWAWATVPYVAAQLPTMWALRDPEAGINPILPLAAAGAGLAWGALVRRCDGRLVPAILAHGLFDWVVVMTFRLWGVSV